MWILSSKFENSLKDENENYYDEKSKTKNSRDHLNEEWRINDEGIETRVFIDYTLVPYIKILADSF